MTAYRKSTVGFVVVKVAVAGIPYFLMRLNPRWKDINFIGGHAKERDAGSLETTARREFWEEVPAIRRYEVFHLESLTPRVQYGPIKSISRGSEVQYDLQFFLVKIDQSPEILVEMLGSRSKNLWVSQHELVQPRRYRVSGLVKFLNQALPGGLEAIPYSSPTDLGFMRERFERTEGKQIEFALR
jgi:NUDIX domain-containing protein